MNKFNIGFNYQNQISVCLTESLFSQMHNIFYKRINYFLK